MSKALEKQPVDMAGTSSAIDLKEAGGASLMVREESEMKARIVLAREYPRDMGGVGSEIIQSCERRGFAEEALYSYPRGGTQIQGPSVKLAREMARIFGNMYSGMRIVSDDETKVHVKGFCYDLQTNTYFEREAKFSKLIFRKGKGWVQPDERDLRELINRQGAFCERNAILACIPSDIIAGAVEQSQATLRRAVKGPGKKVSTKKMITEFAKMKVTQEMIEHYLGGKIEDAPEDKIVELRGVYKSIADGNSKPEEHFMYPAGEEPHGGTQAVVEQVGESLTFDAANPPDTQWAKK